MLAYSFMLAAGLLVSAPWWLLRMATTQRYREGLRERLGAVPAALRALVAGKKTVWVHAVSVGEVLAASRLVAELGEALGHEFVVVVSTTTRTGQALARERFGASRVFYCPLDFAFAVRAYLRILRPSALVLMESELWPRMLHECKHSGVPVIVVNARVSDRSYSRGMKVRSVWGAVLQMPSLWLAQSDEDARRLVAMGAHAESVRVGGNLKYDVRAPKESRVAELIKEAAAGRPIVVAGSTVHGEPRDEDSYVIHAWEGQPLKDFHALLVLAPRHPERFDHVCAMAEEFPFLRATELLQGMKNADAHGMFVTPEENYGVEIVVLDTIGDLAAVYGVADVAFVGGSLIAKGGHNPLEPAQFGVPIVMGPSFENFRGVVEAMQAENAIAILNESTDPQEQLRPKPTSKELMLKDALEFELVRLLKDHPAASAMGERARAVFEAQQGATARAVEAILGTVNQ